MSQGPSRPASALALSCRRASLALSSGHQHVVSLRALLLSKPHASGAPPGRAPRDLGRVSPGGSAGLPTPDQTHTGPRPASTCAPPLAQERGQRWRVRRCHLGSGTASEEHRRHTPAGATLPPGSGPLWVIPGTEHARMTTHQSPSSLWRCCRGPPKVRAILPYAGRGVNAFLVARGCTLASVVAPWRVASWSSCGSIRRQ